MNKSAHTLMPVLLLFAMSVLAQGQLINGNFETGDLTGWTPFNTLHGGTGGPQAVQFDTTGTGVPSFSAQFEVGETSGTIGGGGLGEGAGILQYITLGAGQLNIHLDIAAYNPVPAADAGTFELLWDGNVVSTYAFGGSGFSQTRRSQLSYTSMVTAGVHEIAIDMRVGYGGAGYGYTPYQYLDNIVLEGTAVPEPSVAMVLSFSLLVLAVGFRKSPHRSPPSARASASAACSKPVQRPCRRYVGSFAAL
jgi:hypothetical protein